MKVHNFFKKNLSFLVVFVFCYAVMPQVRAQSLVGTWSDLLTELAKPSVTVIQLTDTIEVPAGTHSLTSAAGGTVIYPMADSRHFLIPSGTVEMTFNNVILDGGWDGVSDTYIGGGIRIEGSSTEVTLNGAVVQNCQVLDWGGAIFNEGILTLNNCTITHNRANTIDIIVDSKGRGGGVYVENGELTIYGSIITNNRAANTSAARGGGGVYVEHGKFTMHSGKINGNGEGGEADGGGVGMWDCEFTMHDGEINGNWGSGISMSGTKFIMYNGTINNNESGIGGGIHFSNSTFEMWNGEISYNRANMSGGAIELEHRNKLTLYNGKIVGNIAMVGGGISAINGEDNIITMEDGEISENKAIFGGGVFGIDRFEFDMRGGKISNNIASRSDVIADIAFSAMLQRDAESIGVNISDMIDASINAFSSFFGMSADCGGGVYLPNIYPPYLFTMSGGSLIGNSAPYGDGGGIFTADLNNVTIGSAAIFSGNTAREAYRLENTPNDSIYNPGVPISAGDLKNLNLVPNNVSIPSNIALSAPPSGDPFKYAYNNYDINYTYTGTIGDIPIDTVCFTDSVTLAVAVIDGGQNPTYQWILNGVEIIGANDSIFKYKSNGRDTILCKVYPDTACGDEVYSEIMIIEMLDSLALDQPDNDEVCSGETIPNITFSGVYDYVKWEVTTGNGLTIGMPANSGIGDISAFTTINSGIVTITATPVSGKCEGISKTFTITVNPKQKPKATIRVR